MAYSINNWVYIHTAHTTFGVFLNHMLCLFIEIIDGLFN